MRDLLNHLNNKILINALIVKKMKYEVGMLFHDSPSKERAKILAKKINDQLDSALLGINQEDKEAVRKSLIENSFLIIPNPVSEHIHYGHVFTTLTNFDERPTATEDRLCSWLDSNTEIDYDKQLIKSYVTQYKSEKNKIPVKSAAIQYVPKEKQAPIPTKDSRYKFTKKALLIPVAVITIVFFAVLLDQKKNFQSPVDMPPLYKYTLSKEMEEFIDGYYNELKQLNANLDPYNYRALSTKAVYAYLKSRDSALLDEDYLFTIDALSKEYNTNPLILLAIIGQEQAFVPNDHADKEQILNNPYNVYGSWMTYNTTFDQATLICLNTIETAKNSLPKNENLIDWLNETYAEDKNWSQGVKSLFTKLQSLN